ncbi:MAG: copper resistance protein CopC [Mycobacteriales bacterium]
MSRRWARRIALLALGAACTFFAQVSVAVPAQAHAEYVRSTPADGEQLSRSPSQVSIVLSEAVEERLTTITLTDGDERRIDVTSVRVRPVRSSGAEEQVELVIALPPLRTNSYRLAWSTVSSDDLHKSNGAVVFGVGRRVTAATARAPAEPAPAPLEVTFRWLGFLTLGAGLGSGVLLWLMRTVAAVPAAVQRTRRRLLALAASAMGVAAISGLGLLVAQTRGHGTGAFAAVRDQLTSTSYGPRWATREVAIVALALVALALLRRTRAGSPPYPRGVLWLVVAPAVVAIGVMSALLGHAGATADTAPGRVVVDAVHLLAAMVWAGSVMAAGVALLPGREPGGRRLAVLILRRFSLVAVVSTGILAATGLFLAGRGVASFDALLLSLYGRTLLVKVALIALALSFGLVNTLLLRRPAAARLLGRTVAVEAALAAIVLGAAALLSSTSPATGRQWTPAPEAGAPPLQSATVADLVETVSVKPNAPGANFIAVNVIDTRRPAPAPIGAVVVTLRAADGVVLNRAASPDGTGAYVIATDAVASSGRWAVTVEVSRTGLAPAVHEFNWVVDPAAPPTRAVIVSRAAVAPLFDRIALGVLAAVLLWVTVAWVRLRRRPTRTEVPPADHTTGADGRIRGRHSMAGRPR